MIIQDEIRQAFEAGANLVSSVSGGKDSDAMTYELQAMWRREGYKGDFQLVHADLGRAEHWQTPAYVRELAERLGLPVNIVEHSKYDLLDGIRQRMKDNPGIVPWPSSTARYCTAGWKRGPISKWIRNFYPTGVVVCAMGMRAEESTAREKLEPVTLREDCCASFRTVYNWLPIHHYCEADVWQVLNGKPRHPMYDKGNERLSCNLCVLASRNDLLNGINNDPALYVEYCRIEVESGFAFRHNFWLGALKPELLPEDMLTWYESRGIVI